MRRLLVLTVVLATAVLPGCFGGEEAPFACLNYQVLQRDDADPDRLIVAANVANGDHGETLKGERLRLVLNLTETSSGEVTTLPLEWSGDDVRPRYLVQELYRLTPPANGTAFALGGYMVYGDVLVHASNSCKGLA